MKATNGIISSLTGFQGDVTTFQISAAVQAGNSGGPLITNDGRLVGIVNAKLTESDNVSYAIKVGYLEQLLTLTDFMMESGEASEALLANTIERLQENVVLVASWK